MHLRTCPIDVLYHEDFDLTGVFGFLVCATLVLRLCRRYGLLWLAPVCSTFVWIGRSKFRRSVCWPLGDVRREDVRRGNLLCNPSLILAVLCDCRRVQWALEQPLSSVMECMQRFQKRLKAKPRVRSRAYWLCDFDADTAKPVRSFTAFMIVPDTCL